MVADVEVGARDEPLQGRATVEAPADAWYCVVASKDLRAGKLLGRKLRGEAIVLGRDAQGQAFALRDRCPHRGVVLSTGRMVDGTVECPFHGWRFGTDGRCRAIPALSAEDRADPGKVRVAAYRLIERNGLIWIYSGERDPSDAPPLPDLQGFADRGPDLVMVEPVKASYDQTVLSLIDPAHGPFVHAMWWWRPENSAREKLKRYEPSPFGFTMVPHAASANSRGYRVLGKDPTRVDIAFTLPGLRVERIRQGPHLAYNLTSIVPIDRENSAMLNALWWSPRWLDLMKPIGRQLMKGFLAQDRRILEKASPGLAGEPSMMLVGDADRLARWYLRIKREYERARAEGRPFQNPIEPTELRWKT